MKSYWLIIVFAFISCNKEHNVIGSYVSRTATNMEAIKLMYLKGYYPFLETYDDYIKLIIEKDSTFLYIINGKEHSGRWKVNGRALILDYTDVSRDDLELKILNNKLYNITEVTLCKSKKRMMSLMLLKKTLP